MKKSKLKFLKKIKVAKLTIDQTRVVNGGGNPGRDGTPGDNVTNNGAPSPC